MRKLKISLLTFLLLFSMADLWAFCGFYVAKADVKLYNKTSQVIIVRDGNHSVVTMSSDFQGDVKDFAMVVPVPEVLKKEQVITVPARIFQKCDDYSAPRLVEYYDPAPCQRPIPVPMEAAPSSIEIYDLVDEDADMSEDVTEYSVTIEEQFEVAEYDILILSAEESDGLERWLVDNGYKIPEGAAEVLEPYIKSEMKFFVVKVNLDRIALSPTQALSPIQISYSTNNFMLPIRLGMANADGDQDMLVYTFTKSGRVETTNYRSTRIPTDKEVPLFVKNRFGEFYNDLFTKSWKRKGKNTVWLEYAWDISATSPVKCDPCNTSLFTYQELKEAGIDWVAPTNWGQYTGDLFMTRLHVRYNRKKFPQDLSFQITPDKKNFQGRYVLNHPAGGPFDCREGKKYVKSLRERREKEVKTLASLTGWKTGQFYDYVHAYDQFLPKSEPAGNGSGQIENGPATPEGLVNDNTNVDSASLGKTNANVGAIAQVEARDSFVPEEIEKSADPAYMAGAEEKKGKNWLLLPFIVLGIIGVFFLSRKKKTNFPE